MTFGDANNGLISEVECYEENGNIYYNAKIRFYVFDCYRWDKGGSEDDLYKLHYYGFCRSFLDYGCYETTVSWKKGARYPYNIFYDDLKDHSFDNINDSNLQWAYTTGCNYYNGSM